MKRKLSLFMACVLTISLLAIPGFAASEDTYEPPIIKEEYTYLANAWAGLTPTGRGWYDVTGGAGSTYATMNIKVTVTLQKMALGGWQNIATWAGSGSFSASAGGSRYIASSGTYRTKMYAAIYNEDGTFGEDVTVCSDHLIIP